ncbi:unnamed protein product, partial [Heterotrigona itama]
HVRVDTRAKIFGDDDPGDLQQNDMCFDHPRAKIFRKCVCTHVCVHTFDDSLSV